MALKGVSLVAVVMVLVTILTAQATAQSDCTNVIIGMASCLNFVTGSSSTPSASCCSQLASVVISQPRCLCMVLNGGGAQLGVSINETLALALPAACNVQTPPPSECNAGNGAASSPARSPEGLPGDVSITQGGSKTTPSTGTSGAVMLAVSLQFVLFFVVMADHASTSSIF